ncbi:MAG: hypothetical protein ACTSU8_05765 [Alphaproteobacteria bacterium]
MKKGQVVANTASMKVPRAVSEMLPFPEAKKEFDKFKKAGAWPLQEGGPQTSPRPILQLKADSGKVEDSHKIK